MKTFPLICFLALCLLSPMASAQDILKGTWQGLITQEPAGLDSIYAFTLTIEEVGEEVRGYTLIHMKDRPQYYGKISFTGRLQDGQLHIEEQKIEEEQLFGYAYWCIKDLFLSLYEEDGKFILQGTWKSGTCAWSVGTIYLERIIS